MESNEKTLPLQRRRNVGAHRWQRMNNDES
jgi:hypothetical protein